MIMNTTERTVLKITTELLNDKTVLSDVNISEQEIFRELSSQKMLALTYPWAKTHCLDHLLKSQWNKYFMAQVYRWYAMMEEQKKLGQLLTTHGYDYAIIKGTASGIYYPVPQARGSGDIDFLVRWDEYDEIYDLLLQHGYVLVGEKIESKHHVEVKKNNVLFEMHKRPGGTRINRTKEHQEIIDFFQDGLKEIEQVTIGDYTFPVLPKLQNAMVLLLHTAQHMKGGLGLRHILDWMMFAKVYVDDEFWYSELEAMAKKGKVDTLAKVMTRMCQKYIGLTSDITWCNDAYEVTCDQLMEYILQQGDFGSKAGWKDQEVRVLAESKNFFVFFQQMHESSLYSMPIARKRIWLRPIAWGYQMLRYIKKGLQREKPIETFRVNKAQGNRRRKLFNDLGLDGY